MKIDRRKFLSASMGFLAGAAAPGIIGEEIHARQSSKRPNIVLINTDDQPSWWVGVYGNQDIHTPNMDLLAKEGMLFNTAVTTPVCSPSRAMLLTGRYNNQVGIDDFINNDEVTGLPSGSVTFARVLYHGNCRQVASGKGTGILADSSGIRLLGGIYQCVWAERPHTYGKKGR